MKDHVLTTAEFDQFVRDVWLAETMARLDLEEAADTTERQPSPRDEIEKQS